MEKGALMKAERIAELRLLADFPSAIAARTETICSK